ncbi:rhodanese-like domain-containing protein [Paraferrimonas haliotis]
MTPIDLQTLVKPNPISLREASTLVGREDITFYDVNTLEIWADGHVPGSVYFNVKRWKRLLPENKDATLIFYCANQLCDSSREAAVSTMELGYTNVFHMADGIWGWRQRGYPIERP